MRNVDENEPSSVPERATRSAYVRLPSSPSRAYGIGMPAEEARWTLDMVRALPDDGNRYEVLDGVLLVTPIPTLLHQRAIGERATGTCPASPARRVYFGRTGASPEIRK